MECILSGLYTTTMRPIESHYVAGPASRTAHEITLWHDRLRHSRRTSISRILKSSHGHPLTRSLGSIHGIACQTCYMGKFIIKTSYDKIGSNPSTFLQRIMGDICGLIHPPYRPFRYFMVLVYASTCWSHMWLLSTRNAAFSKLLAQVIKLGAHHPDYSIKSIQLDNVGEFTSKTINDYCMSVGAEVKHQVPHVHTQNGLAEAFIKHLKMIARSLVIHTKLLIASWGHAILHIAMLVFLRPIATNHIAPFSWLLDTNSTNCICAFLVVRLSLLWDSLSIVRARYELHHSWRMTRTIMDDSHFVSFRSPHHLVWNWSAGHIRSSELSSEHAICFHWSSVSDNTTYSSCECACKWFTPPEEETHYTGSCGAYRESDCCLLILSNSWGNSKLRKHPWKDESTSRESRIGRFQSIMLAWMMFGVESSSYWL